MVTESVATTRRTKRPRYQGEPTLGQVMRRPQWLVAFVLVMAIAAAFAALAQWQLSSAVRLNAEEAADTETAVPLQQRLQPGTPITADAAGYRVSLNAQIDASSPLYVAERMNQNHKGYWLVVRASDPAANNAEIALAVGWAKNLETVKQAAQKLAADPTAFTSAGADTVALEARLMPSESPSRPETKAGVKVLQTLAPGQAINIWDSPAIPHYAGYLVLEKQAALIKQLGLEEIDSTAPLPPETINWLNLFYGIEWVLFAGFAFYFWIRLCRDAHEREHELKLQQQEAQND